MTGESVLVVEDEGLIALHLAELLEKAGYRVPDPAYSGEMVLQLLGESLVPDLILMDIGLSGKLDGIETARQIRQKFPVPLIFLTAYSSERTIERMRAVAPDGYLSKPVMEQDLLTVVAKVLDKNRKTP
jgi:CheY-like chemotaxis protein